MDRLAACRHALVSSYGYSIGISDCVPNPEIESQFNEVIKRSIETVAQGTEAARAGRRIASKSACAFCRVMLNCAQVVLVRGSKNRIYGASKVAPKAKTQYLSNSSLSGTTDSHGKAHLSLHGPDSAPLSTYAEDEMEHPVTHGLITESYFQDWILLDFSCTA